MKVKTNLSEKFFLFLTEEQFRQVIQGKFKKLILGRNLFHSASVKTENNH